MSRAMRLEAKIAADNQKKRTVARAPNFASDARAKRKIETTPEMMMFMSPRKPVVPREPVTPTLFTLERAR